MALNTVPREPASRFLPLKLDDDDENRMGKRRKKLDTKIDRISDLPDHIIDKILSHLPVKDAARTSLLSKHWRHKWGTLPCLAFDGKSFPICSIDYIYRERADEIAEFYKIASIIDQILSLHSGPINKFKFSAHDCISHRVFDWWVSSLSASFVREFVFEIFASETEYPLPPCFYSFEKLTHLELRECAISPPPGFKGFKNLKTLHLESTHSTEGACGKLISNSPVLETLTLWDVYGVDSLDIDSPSLRFLKLNGGFDYVTFGNNSSLEEVVIDSAFLFDSMNVFTDILSLPNLKRLHLGVSFTRALFEKVPPRGKHPVCINLKYLKISACFFSNQLHIIAPFLLRSAPNVEGLKIDVSFEAEEGINNCFEEADIGSLSFNKLRHIKIKGVVGCQSQMDFVNYMLSASPVLETMTVKLDEDHDLLGSIKKLRFKRGLSQAEIILELP